MNNQVESVRLAIELAEHPFVEALLYAADDQIPILVHNAIRAIQCSASLRYYLGQVDINSNSKIDLQPIENVPYVSTDSVDTIQDAIRLATVEFLFSPLEREIIEKVYADLYVIFNESRGTPQLNIISRFFHKKKERLYIYSEMERSFYGSISDDTAAAEAYLDETLTQARNLMVSQAIDLNEIPNSSKKLLSDLTLLFRSNACHSAMCILRSAIEYYKSLNFQGLATTQITLIEAYTLLFKFKLSYETNSKYQNNAKPDESLLDMATISEELKTNLSLLDDSATISEELETELPRLNEAAMILEEMETELPRLNEAAVFSIMLCRVLLYSAEYRNDEEIRSLIAIIESHEDSYTKHKYRLALHRFRDHYPILLNGSSVSSPIAKSIDDLILDDDKILIGSYIYRSLNNFNDEELLKTYVYCLNNKHNSNLHIDDVRRFLRHDRGQIVHLDYFELHHALEADPGMEELDPPIPYYLVFLCSHDHSLSAEICLTDAWETAREISDYRAHLQGYDEVEYWANTAHGKLKFSISYGPPNTHEDFTRRKALRLAHTLIGGLPITTHRISKIIVCAVGDIQYIPFESLPLINEDTESWLGLQFSIIYQEISPILDDRNYSIKEVSLWDEVHVFADPSYDMGGKGHEVILAGIKSKWRNLTHSSDEALAIANLTTATLWTKEDASKVNVCNLMQSTILHFATHAFSAMTNRHMPKHLYTMESRRIVADYPTEIIKQGVILSGANNRISDDDEMIFWESGILNVQDIENLNLSQTHLVVLSACEAAMGNLESDGSINSLRSAFIHAGVSGVVASSWKADDAATSLFMKSFYQALIQKESTSDALLYARRECSTAGYAVSMWANFTYLGREIKQYG